MAASNLSSEVVHVAIGDDRNTSHSLVQWSVRNFPGRTLRITHIFSHKINNITGRFLRRNETAERIKNRRVCQLSFLDQCVSLCSQAGLAADSLYREAESVVEGLVKLIDELNIKWLVIGAAASQRNNSGIGAIASKKALHVFQFAPSYCKIWFVCNGILFYTRKAVRAPESMSEHQSVGPVSAAEDNGAEESDDGSTVDDLFSNSRDEQRTDSFLIQLSEIIANAKNCEAELLEAQRRCSIAATNMAAIARKTEGLESQYSEDLIVTRELEEARLKDEEAHDDTRKERDSFILDLQSALDEKYCLELQIEELQQELDTKAESMAKIVDELEALKIQNEKLVDEAKELGQKSSILTFSESEINKSTRNFDGSRVIGEGGYGKIYRGDLHNTEVAVKVLRQNGWQGENEYRQEVNVLGSMRHPNIVTLIGACPEKMALVYEYLPNGSLEDRLDRKNGTPPLNWQARVRIAIELCSALTFLHCNARHCVVHGDVKPSNILLDSNMGAKLSDFGVCRTLLHHEDSGHSKTLIATGPKGSFAYIDPEFLQFGELSPKSDIYSFGVVLLRMLTGKSATRVLKEVKDAVQNDRLGSVLDTSAGSWPMDLVEKIVFLAMDCCKTTQDSRPSVEYVWRCLHLMKPTETAPHCGEEPPAYFLCPIKMDIMEDPHVAADGYTYEKETLREWFELGHDTSPLTNLKLSHCNLVPNIALRSAIQDWVQLQQGGSLS